MMRREEERREEKRREEERRGEKNREEKRRVGFLFFSTCDDGGVRGEEPLAPPGKK